MSLHAYLRGILLNRRAVLSSTEESTARDSQRESWLSLRMWPLVGEPCFKAGLTPKHHKLDLMNLKMKDSAWSWVDSGWGGSGRCVWGGEYDQNSVWIAQNIKNMLYFKRQFKKMPAGHHLPLAYTLTKRNRESELGKLNGSGLSGLPGKQKG